MIRSSRLQISLGALALVVLASGLALGLARAWWRRESGTPTASERIVSEIFASRESRRPSTLAPTGDPALLGGFVAVVLLGSAFRKVSRDSSN